MPNYLGYPSEKLSISPIYDKIHLMSQPLSPNSACFFLGYPRSGHTLIGAILDAHPNICISHEEDVLGQLLRGEIEPQLVAEFIIEKSHQTLAEGRAHAGYRYLIENQWQGKYKELHIIGDKTGGRSSRILDQYGSGIKVLEVSLGIPIRFIHVYSNPYDAISTSANRALQRRPKMDLSEIFLKKSKRFFDQASAIHQFQATNHQLVYSLQFEHFVKQPKKELSRMLEWLEVPSPADYLDACASIVFAKPREPRTESQWWNHRRIRSVADNLDNIPSFKSYSF